MEGLGVMCLMVQNEMKRAKKKFGLENEPQIQVHHSVSRRHQAWQKFSEIKRVQFHVKCAKNKVKRKINHI